MEVDMRDIAKLIPAMGAMASKVVLVALEAALDSEDKLVSSHFLFKFSRK